ncbi:MAG: HAMP domain-containing protein [Anaerolineae bacterium]|nr:HAMP domain-containing protein [Anaerolineae bacterium]
MFSSIRVRLMFSHLAVIILAMGLSGFLLLEFAEHYFLQATEDSLVAQARITAQALIPGAMVGAPPGDADVSAYNRIQQQQVGNLYVQTDNVEAVPLSDTDITYLSSASVQLGTQLDTRIRVLDNSGIVLVDSEPGGSNSGLQNEPMLRRALAGDYGTWTTGASENHMMHVALPVLVQEQQVGVVYLSQSLRDVAAVVSDLRMRLALATVVGLALSGVVGLLLSQAVTRPLRRLTAAVSAVAQGDFSRKVAVYSRDELGRLSRSFNDMTTRLRAARQMQVDFVANVSHELRTPLTTIKGMVETLRAGAVDDITVRDSFLTTVENETDRLIRLVNDLLLLSRVDSEALALRRNTVNLVDLVRATADRLTSRDECRLVIEPNVASASSTSVWADADRLAQVFTNVLDNAFKYSQPGGLVTVSVDTLVDQTAVVRVRDQGIGIAAGDLPRIGERFFRADKARSRQHGGSGLGLAIAQALVQAHGGRLWVESEEGTGTIVSFSLPAM